jgi:hypothetical protein
MRRNATLAAPLVAAALASVQALAAPVEPAQVLTRIPAVQGRVTDPAGQPIAGAAVNYVFLEKNLRGGTVTNAAGEFEHRFPVYNGLHRFEVSAKGYRSWTSAVVKVEAGRTLRMDVTLQPLDAGPPVRLTPAEYRTRAVESAVETLRLRYVSTSNVRIDVIADPDLAPDHAGLHRRLGGSGGSAQVPDALVRVAIWRGGRFDQTATVVFRGTAATTELSYNGSPGFLPLEEGEWRQVAVALEPFYAAAVDAGRGWQRFVPFLPDDMRAMLRHNAAKMRLFLPIEAIDALSQDDLRRFVALMLDVVMLQRWSMVEGLEGIDDELRATGDGRTDPKAFIDRVESAAARIRGRLESLGAFDEEHAARVSGFLRRMAGEGLVAREAPQRDRITIVPRGVGMYSAPLGGWTAAPFPHFILIDARPLMVAIDLP